MKPMLCTPIKTEFELNTLLDSDNWVMQQKLDGQRIVTHYGSNGFLQQFNRNGEGTTLLEHTHTQYGYIDSEYVNGAYYAFDYIPEDLRNMHLADRLIAGKKLYPDLNWVPTYVTPEQKREAFEECRDSHREGVVFKRLTGYYKPGQRAREWRKYKFVETADVMVSAIGVNGPLSLGMAMFHNGELIEVGTVKTQPEVLAHIAIGSVIEVKYLYASKTSNKLYQPVWGCVRKDKAPAECTTDQLKYTNKEILNA